MPNTTIRRGLGPAAAGPPTRLDDWTLIAFNPRYPSPADHR